MSEPPIQPVPPVQPVQPAQPAQPVPPVQPGAPDRPVPPIAGQQLAPGQQPPPSSPPFPGPALAVPPHPTSDPSADPATAPALATRGLVKVYGNLVAVGDLSLDIPTGSFYGIVGPNGAGKTTMLTMATGLLVPDRGTAFVHGIDVWRDPVAAKAQMGVMPDGMRLLDKLSGPDFLTHVAMLRGIDRDTARARTTELLTALDLQEAGKKLIADYSAGMTKKVALGAALIHGPRVVVLDEPFESVDPVSSANIRQILQEFVRSGGTVILSSHVMATVQKLCTHVAVINHGRVLVAGTTQEVAAGMDLDDRFAQLVGGRHVEEGLSWLRS